MTEVNDDNYTALPDSYLADLCEFLVGHGKTKAADELADRMSGEWSGE